MVEFIDKTEEKNGTPINRKNLMAMQGFISNNISFNSDGSIVIVNSDGQKLTITFGSDGSIIEVFEGEKTITKTTKFEGNNIVEVIS